MAYVHVPEWTPEQVADWLKGLDDALRPYIHSFLNNDIDGRHLMMLAADDLHNLHIWKLGHQQLVLETVEQLRQSYFHLDSENLQWLALRLSCKARSVFNELLRLRTGPSADGAQDRVATSTLSSVADVLTSVKAMVSWLDRPPFERQEPHSTMRKTLLQLSVELATNGQRDKFAERPNDVIREICLNIANMCDELIKESKDPLILQPASLEVATITKKSNEELGMHIESLYTGIHIIGRVKYQSPASAGGRVEAGDEIVQVNHQTVVGWQLKKLVAAMKDNATEVILTLKKRPKHISGFGRIFPHHFLIPSKKPSSNLQPRKSISRNSIKATKILTPPPPLLVPATMTLIPAEPINALLASDQSYIGAIETTTEDEDDDSAFLSEVDSRSSVAEVHLAVPKLHVALQRRATVTGASPTASRPPVSIDQLWHDVKRDQVIRSYSHDITASDPHVQFRLPPSPREGAPSTPQQSQDEFVPAGGVSGGGSNGLRSTRVPLTRPVTCIGDVGGFEPARGIRGPLLQQARIQFDPRTVVPPQQQIAGANAALRFDSAVTPVGSGVVGVEHPPASDPNCAGLISAPVAPVTPCFVAVATLASSARDSASYTRDNRRNESTQTPPQELGRFVTTCQASSDICPQVSSEQQWTDQDKRSQKAQDQAHRSYQVVIVGGVPQKSPSSCKDSPVLRRKPKREFAIRRISCKDLGQGDCQGWLLRGRITKGFLHHFKWSKQWCVLKNTGFYCYEDNNAFKAECYVCLVGFSISPAIECKMKFAFKVHHSGTAFFFASDSQVDMSKWMNKMGLAAIAYNTQSCATTSGFHRPAKQSATSEGVYFSDSEDDDDKESDVESSKTHGLQQSASNSSLSSSSSYYSLLESLSPTSPSLDERLQPSMVGSCSGQSNPRDESFESDDSFGEVRPSLTAIASTNDCDNTLHRHQGLPSTAPKLSVNASRPHAIATSNVPVSNLASIHLHTVCTSNQRDSSSSSLSSTTLPAHTNCEAFNPLFLLSTINRMDTMPALPTTGQQSPNSFDVLRKAVSSVDFSHRQTNVGSDGDEFAAWSNCHSPGTSATLPGCCGGGDSRKMSLAFEMNLDSSSPLQPPLTTVMATGEALSRRDMMLDTRNRREDRSPSQSSTESLRSSKSVSALKLFGSPKFVKKLMGGGNGTGNGHSTWGGEMGRAALKKRSLWATADDSVDVSSRVNASCSHLNQQSGGATITTNAPSPAKTFGNKAESSAVERRFLGSPKLARAIYRAIHHHQHKKNLPILADNATRDSADERSGTKALETIVKEKKAGTKVLDYRMLDEIRISSIPSHPDDVATSRKANALDQPVPVQQSIEFLPPPLPPPGRALRLDLVAASTATSEGMSSDVVVPSSAESTPGTPRMPMKPAMGVSMIGKQRRTSSQTSSTSADVLLPTKSSATLPASGLQTYSGSATMSSASTQTDNG